MSKEFWVEEGKKIRLARLARKMSQTELAKAAGVKQGVVSKYERGEPGAAETRRKIMEALGLGVFV